MLTKSLFDNAAFDIAHEMDRLFESMAAPRTLPAFRSRWAFPALNVWEDDQNLYVEGELPGINREDLEVSVAGDQLVIKGQRRLDLPEQATALRRERLVGSFERSISLPAAIHAERVEANLREGILWITLPKTEGCQPRRIEVKTDRAS